MTDTICEHDFVVLDYTGHLPNGHVFDTTQETVARAFSLPARQGGYAPARICVGERQLLPGLDSHLIGMKIGVKHTITLSPEEAFGKRDVKNVKIVPFNYFKEYKVQPYPGLQINVDGEVGTVKSVSGGRVIVNFNHPLAGQEVVYDVTVHSKITDPVAQLHAFFEASMKLPAGQVVVKEESDRIHVALDVAFPVAFTDVLSKKLTDLIKGKIVIVSAKKE